MLSQLSQEGIRVDQQEILGSIPTGGIFFAEFIFLFPT